MYILLQLSSNNCIKRKSFRSLRTQTEKPAIRERCQEHDAPSSVFSQIQMVVSVRHLSLIKMKQPARMEHYTVQDNGISVSIVSETGIGLRETTPAGWNSSFLAANVAEETKRRGKERSTTWWRLCATSLVNEEKSAT